jgi:NADPH:quinone reductase-like Zn-dependent oxidoreductase
VRAWEIQGFALERLARVERPDPVPGPGQVVVGVRAASLNYRDLMMVQGRYNPRQPLPLVPLSDGVGEVLEVGDGVTRVEPGDRVVGAFAQGWVSGEPPREASRTTLGGPRDGVLAERVLLDAAGVVRVPDAIDDLDAATLPCAGVTAWNAVFAVGRVRPGETVVVLGTGGVSLFALQLSRLAGARVVVTSSSDAKLERARELGAWQTLNYREEPEWDRRVRELTGGAGADLVIEVGGAGTLARSLGALRPGGAAALIGVLAGHAGELDLRPILMRRLRVEGVLVGSRADLEALVAAVEQHRLKPCIDRVFGFPEAPEAFRELESARHFGKLVIRVT